MSDVYIRNRAGVAHSVPEHVWPVAQSQGAVKITKREYDKLMKQQARTEPEAEPTDDESAG